MSHEEVKQYIGVSKEAGLSPEERRELFDLSKETPEEVVKSFLDIFSKREDLSVDDTMKLGGYIMERSSKSETPVVLNENEKRLVEKAVEFIERWIESGNISDFEIGDNNYQKYLAALTFIVNQLSKLVEVETNKDIVFNEEPFEKLYLEVVSSIPEYFDEERIKEIALGLKKEEEALVLKIEELKQQNKISKDSMSGLIQKVRSDFISGFEKISKQIKKQGIEKVKRILERAGVSSVITRVLTGDVTLIQSLKEEKRISEDDLTYLLFFVHGLNEDEKKLFNFLAVKESDKANEYSSLNAKSNQSENEILKLQIDLNNCRKSYKKIKHLQHNIPFVRQRVAFSAKKVRQELIQKNKLPYFLKAVLVATERQRRGEQEGFHAHINPCDWVDQLQTRSRGDLPFFDFKNFPTDTFPAQVHLLHRFLPFAALTASFLRDKKKID
ncbi:MAG: hypothetical protein QG585_271 [Patescibacteria group bacterium]|nr:hypothetical protein [Patescibacteria group bacterium]